jgi:hypothetical protein
MANPPAKASDFVGQGASAKDKSNLVIAHWYSTAHSDYRTMSATDVEVTLCKYISSIFSLVGKPKGVVQHRMLPREGFLEIFRFVVRIFQQVSIKFSSLHKFLSKSFRFLGGVGGAVFLTQGCIQSCRSLLHHGLAGQYTFNGTCQGFVGHVFKSQLFKFNSYPDG